MTRATVHTWGPCPHWGPRPVCGAEFKPRQRGREASLQACGVGSVCVGDSLPEPGEWVSWPEGGAREPEQTVGPLRSGREGGLPLIRYSRSGRADPTLRPCADISDPRTSRAVSLARSLLYLQRRILLLLRECEGDSGRHKSSVRVSHSVAAAAELVAAAAETEHEATSALLSRVMVPCNASCHLTDRKTVAQRVAPIFPTVS